MPRRPCLFKQTDFARAIKAARAAGITNPCAEITRDGVIRVVAAQAGDSAHRDDLDRELKDFQARHGQG
jgi:hypothetical protein